MKSDSKSSSRVRPSKTAVTRRAENVKGKEAQALTPDSRSDGARLQKLLENLDIKFTNCTFTYKLTHFESEVPVKKRSRLASLRNKIFSSIDKIRENLSSEKIYDKCLFFPTVENEKVTDFVHQNFADIKLTFVNCKFIKRSTTLTEKIAIKLRKIFGIQFELEYVQSTATIDHYTFRLKDILFANHHIQERIIEEA